MASKRVTMVDVARYSGVSQATVSVVLNNTPGQTIPAGPRQRVLAAAEDLAYEPATAARNLARGRSGVLVLDADMNVARSVTEPLFSGLSDRFSAEGFTLLSHVGSPNGHAAQLLKMVKATDAEAVLTVPPRGVDNALFERAGSQVIQLVTDVEWTHGVRAAAREQLRVLTSTGRRCLAYATSHVGVDEFASEVRFAEFAGAVAEAGLPAPWRLEWRDDLEDLTAQVREAVASGVDGIAATNDDVAMGVLSAARTASVFVPQRIAVVGADNSPVGRMFHPTLTTVTYPVTAQSINFMADRALHRLRGTTQQATPVVAASEIHTIRRESA